MSQVDAGTPADAASRFPCSMRTRRRGGRERGLPDRFHARSRCLPLPQSLGRRMGEHHKRTREGVGNSVCAQTEREGMEMRDWGQCGKRKSRARGERERECKRDRSGRTTYTLLLRAHATDMYGGMKGLREPGHLNPQSRLRTHYV